jgi:hypothetical protein
MNTPSRIHHWNKAKEKGETHSDIYFNFLSTAETPQRRQQKQQTKGINVSLSYKKNPEDAIKGRLLQSLEKSQTPSS